MCVARAGVRSISQTHTDQVRLIQQLFPDDAETRKVSNQLAALLDRKNTVEYEARLSRREEAEIALKQAERNRELGTRNAQEIARAGPD